MYDLHHLDISHQAPSNCRHIHYWVATVQSELNMLEARSKTCVQLVIEHINIIENVFLYVIYLILKRNKIKSV